MAVKIIGHRGYSEKFPENTMLSFNKALEFGADGIECDIQKTKDGKFVIIHDDSIDRVAKIAISAGLPVKIKEKTLQELKTYKFASGETIPSLEEFLKEIPQWKFIDIELKTETLSEGDCPAIYKILADHNKLKNLMISSFNPDLLVYFKKMKITTGLLIGENIAQKGFWFFIKTLVKIKPEYLNIPVQVYNMSNKFFVNIIIMILKIMNFKIAFWTVDSAEDFNKVNSIADIIITNRIKFIIDNLKS